MNEVTAGCIETEIEINRKDDGTLTRNGEILKHQRDLIDRLTAELAASTTKLDEAMEEAPPVESPLIPDDLTHRILLLREGKQVYRDELAAMRAERDALREALERCTQKDGEGNPIVLGKQYWCLLNGGQWYQGPVKSFVGGFDEHACSDDPFGGLGEDSYDTKEKAIHASRLKYDANYPTTGDTND